MKNQEINERVAKLCGWEHIKSDKNPNLIYWAKCNGMAYSGSVANYAESLDACREFESAMNAPERAVYADLLVDLCGDDSYDPIFAPSITRCEAFLRLKGQWDEN